MSRGDKSARKGSRGNTSLPKRSRKYGVGKDIGGAIYVHRRYEGVFGSVVEHARKRLPSDFDYTVVKLNQVNHTVSFIQAAEFDTVPEPIVGRVIVVKPDGTSRHMNPPDDPYIYHHKWLFVADDYEGFDVEQSKSRSRAWMAMDKIDRKKIGRKSYWERSVVPWLDLGR